MAYTTSTAVATLLSTTFSSSTDPTDTEVANIIARVQEYIDQYTGRIWTSATTTEYFDTWDEQRYSNYDVLYVPQRVQTTFFLSKRPVISINSLQENTGGLSSENWVSRATGYGNDAIFYGAPGYIDFFDSQPSRGLKNIKVTYTYGVSTTPNDIKYACELLSAVQVIDAIKRASDQEGLSAVSIGNVSYTFNELENQRKRFDAKAMQILDQRGKTVNPKML